LDGTDIKYKLNIADSPCVAEVYGDQIELAITNIINNAVQSLPGGGEIEIKTKITTIEESSSLPLSAGDYLVISIADSGPGINPEDLPRIFEPYFSTRKRAKGLGLTYTYSIVKEHEGYIEVDSAASGGAVFKIYLPALKAVETSVTTKKETVKKSILVVNDETIIQELLSELLSPMGFELQFVASAEKAAKLYKENMRSGKRFDLLLLDLKECGTPEDGELIRTINEMDPKAKAIVSSTNPNDPIITGFEAYGFSAAIKKPYNIGELIETIEGILSGEVTSTLSE
ncbi:MAG: ATP-binding protein, partial [Thermodesulfobacteriota bacterium]